MFEWQHINKRIAISVAVLACLLAALPLSAQYDEWLQKARQAYQAGNYEQCINNCKIYSSMNGSTNKNELQVKAERMLACKTAGTLNAYRYMVQYNPNDTWAKEQLKKTLAMSVDHKFYVFFLPGEWNFDGSQSVVINDIANAIKGDNNVYKLVGYQNYGMASNKLDRARRVKKALVEKGIAANRLEDNSFSFGSLAANNNTQFLTEAVVIEKTNNTNVSLKLKMANDSPAADVEVKVKHKKQTAVSDQNGNLKIEAEVGDTLTFSHRNLPSQFWVVTSTKDNLVLRLKGSDSEEDYITGTVFSSADSSPLIGATVEVKGTKRVTATDINGNYRIKAKRGDTLVFKYIGCKQHETVVSSKCIIVTLADYIGQNQSLINKYKDY